MEGLEIIMTFEKFYQHKTVLVTGGTGFIGSNLVKRLLEAGAQVRCIVRSGCSTWRLEKSKKLVLCEADLSKGTERVFSSACRGVDIIFHLAAAGVHNQSASLSECLKVNVAGTAILLEAARKNNIKKFISAGTCVEFGNVKHQGFITDSTPVAPAGNYAVSKAAQTILTDLFLRSSNMQGFVLRLFYVYGPGELPPKFIPSLIKDALAGIPIRMTGGKQVRDFCFVDDIVSAFLRAGHCGRLANQPVILNIGSGRSLTLRQAAKMILALIPESDGISKHSLPYRVDEIWRLVPETRPASRLLSWQSQTSFNEGLKKTIIWFRQKGKFHAV